MSERHKPHHGRDRSGHLEVKRADVDDLAADPQGGDFIRDDVRFAGAVEDVGPSAGARGKRIAHRADDNGENVERVARPDAGPTGRRSRRGKRR
jgi:hypothetical protein